MLSYIVAMLELIYNTVFSLGRAGTYQYGYEIDNCIESVLKMGKELQSWELY